MRFLSYGPMFPSVFWRQLHTLLRSVGDFTLLLISLTPEQQASGGASALLLIYSRQGLSCRVTVGHGTSVGCSSTTRTEPELESNARMVRKLIRRFMIVASYCIFRKLETDEYTQSALTRIYIEAGMLEKSWLWFRRFHLAGNLSFEGYSANIDAYGERGHVLEAERAFICCQEAKKLTVHEYNVMIKAYGIGKNYDKACQLFDSMKSHDVVPDNCSYNSLIQILAGADLPHMARPYLRMIQEAGLVSDCIPYCAVISSFVKLGHLEMEEGLYKEMIQFNVEPDVVVYGVLINAFADVGSVKEAVTYFDAMKSAGLSANAVIYNSLIKLYTKVGYFKEAPETYKLIQSLEVHPDVYTSNCMIDLYSERSMRNGRFEEATRIAKQMKELSYNNVIGLYALDGRYKDVLGTFKEMIDAAIHPDYCTFKSLGAVLMKRGVPKRAVKKLEITRKKDAESGLQAWIYFNTLICSWSI
ncbi:hypothetical protein EZV62_010012 [Acer yangbiense]|uniref:Pentacotripeptide-repeat region of PRORP domain-containing protein n=1 Tax=Acer yangbiense TaxID=1000413 RepID=A0A5C7I225_9ROSI|nr:hypothetical protein EZV62_010012 [Acer yangbiense]